MNYKLFNLIFSENNKTECVNCYNLAELQVCSEYVKNNPECKLISMQIDQRYTVKNPTT